jgi:hypothetical protein
MIKYVYMNQDLQKAVTERRSHGYSDEKIRLELQQAGYDESAIASILALDNENDRGADVALPPALTLLNQGIDYVKKRFDLALALAAPMVVLSAVEYFSNLYPENSNFQVASVFIIVISLITYYLVFLASLYSVCHDDEREVPFREAMAWSRQHALPYAGLAILSGLMVWGGLALLVVPGIALALYFFLARYVFVFEGLRGFAALQRSFDLVHGNWWQLAWRLLIVGVLISIIFMVIGILITAGMVAAAETPEAKFLGDALLNILTAFVTLVNIVVGLKLYQSLATRSVTASDHHTIFSVLVALGGFVLIGSLVTGFWFTNYVMDNPSFWENLPVEESLETESSSESEAKERAEALRLEDDPAE